MKKEEILQKSREENAAAYMDEGEWALRLREDSLALGFGLVLAMLLLGIKVYRGQSAADMLTMITGISAAGFIFRAGKSRKKSDRIFAALCTALALFYFIKFLMGTP